MTHKLVGLVYYYVNFFENWIEIENLAHDKIQKFQYFLNMSGVMLDNVKTFIATLWVIKLPTKNITMNFFKYLIFPVHVWRWNIFWKNKFGQIFIPLDINQMLKNKKTTFFGAL